jgi:hypothetical protein
MFLLYFEIPKRQLVRKQTLIDAFLVPESTCVCEKAQETAREGWQILYSRHLNIAQVFMPSAV